MLRFTLNIPAAEYLRFYQGEARSVIVQSWEGHTLQFPAALLTRFVTRDGISGDFTIAFDQNNKLLSLDRLQ
ncbi:MAG: DUF2835 domain-containing protein [Gammaproteobacteria bacterium]|nr:DUF2835 domain-containing protein [Gammaproteobacteria bacterium]